MKRQIWMLLGVFLLGFGGAMLRLSNLGTDPFTCINLGISNLTHISYGTSQLLFNIILIIPMLFCYRQGLGIGTIVNMAGFGYVSDFCVYVWKNLGVTSEAMMENRIACVGFLFIGIWIFCLGIAFYMEGNLGVAPYDALGIMVETWTKGKIVFSVTRIITDFLCVAVGFFLGSTVGIATLVTAFFTGPMVSFFRKKVKIK